MNFNNTTSKACCQNSIPGRLFGKKKNLDPNCVVDEVIAQKLPDGSNAARVSFWQMKENGEKEVRKTILLPEKALRFVEVGDEYKLSWLQEKGMRLALVAEVRNDLDRVGKPDVRYTEISNMSEKEKERVVEAAFEKLFEELS